MPHVPITKWHLVRIDQKWINLSGSIETHVPITTWQPIQLNHKWINIIIPNKLGLVRVLTTTIEGKPQLYLSIHASYYKANHTSPYREAILHSSSPALSPQWCLSVFRCTTVVPMVELFCVPVNQGRLCHREGKQIPCASLIFWSSLPCIRWRAAQVTPGYH